MLKIVDDTNGYVWEEFPDVTVQPGQTITISGIEYEVILDEQDWMYIEMSRRHWFALVATYNHNVPASIINLEVTDPLVVLMLQMPDKVIRDWATVTDTALYVIYGTVLSSHAYLRIKEFYDAMAGTDPPFKLTKDK